MGVNHVLLHVKSIEAAKAFYLVALRPLGYTLHADFGKTCGFGIGKDRPDFWLRETADAAGSVHVGFSGRGPSEVDAWYAAAIEAGGKDNGAPGVRAMYSDKYYAAFVLDPDGNNVECDSYHGGAYKSG